MTTASGVIAPPPQDASWARMIGPGARAQIAVLAVLLVVAYWAPLNDFVIARWLSDPNWSHGWLVPLFVLYFLSTQKEELAMARRRVHAGGLLLLIASVGLYFGSMIVLPHAYPQVLSLIVAVLGLTLFLAGPEVFRRVWFPISFLALSIPLPDTLYFKATWPMRVLASELGAKILGLIPDLYTGRSGVVIDYLYRGVPGQLNVEEACSGMRLMMAFVVLGLAMAYLGDRPLWQRVVMVLFCVPIAIFCNVLRVTLTGCAHVFQYESLASGTPHELLGLAMLPIALGLFALVGYVLKHLFIEEPEPA